MADFEKIQDTQAYLVPHSKAVVSPAIIIQIGGVNIGYIKSITETQARPATSQYEVGTVGIVENIPGQPTYTGSGNKMAVYGYNAIRTMALNGIKGSAYFDAIKGKLAQYGITEGNIFQNIVHSPLGFDIVFMEIDPRSNLLDSSSGIYTSKWVDCYITNYTRPINASGDLTIAETFSITFKDIVYS